MCLYQGLAFGLLEALVSWRQITSASNPSKKAFRLVSLFFRTALSPFTFHDTIFMPTLRILPVYGAHVTAKTKSGKEKRGLEASERAIERA